MSAPRTGRRSATILPFDVQRDMAFYRTAVAFRDAVEQMQARHGRLDDPGGGTDEPRDPRRPPDGPWDDGLAGSRVPRSPLPGAGEASVELEEPSEGAVA